MEKTEDPSSPLMGIKDISDLDFPPALGPGHTGGNGYAWELVGEYEEECPVDYERKLVEGQEKHKATKEYVKTINSESKLPKSQNLIVLDDGSLLYTCGRSHLHLKHPNRHGHYQGKVYKYPELSLDITNATSTFLIGRTKMPSTVYLWLGIKSMARFTSVLKIRFSY